MDVEGRRQFMPGAELDMKDGEEPLYVPDLLDGLKEIPETVYENGRTYQFTGLVFGRARYELQ